MTNDPQLQPNKDLILAGAKSWAWYRKLTKGHVSSLTEPPPTKVEGFSGLERLRCTVGSFPTKVGGFKPDFWKMKPDILAVGHHGLLLIQK